MDIRELKCFIAAFQTGSINAAAKDMFVSPQGLGKTLRKIEAEFHVVLFERGHNGIKPTREARILYAASAKLLDDFHDVEQAMRQGTEDGAFRMVLASTYGALSYFGMDMILSFERAHPRVKIDVIEQPDEQVEAMLVSDEAQTGIIAGPLDVDALDARHVASIRHVAILPVNHPLGKKKMISYADFDGENVILIGRQFKPYRNNLNRMARSGAIPERLIEVGEIHKISQFVARGYGIGISVEFEALDSPYPGTLAVPFVEEDCYWDLYVVHPPNHLPSEIEVCLAKHIIQYAKNSKRVS